jgi:hypothetical protein
MKPARTAVALVTLLVASACASSYAEPNRPLPSAFGPPPSSEPVRPLTAISEPWDSTPVPYSPYGVEVVGGDDRRLPTFQQSGRTYVMGAIGDRYRIRITNPTARRVEAVVSVDGLDAIDGKTARFEDKRGYVIPPYGDVTIEGFRTSLQQVATFRFASVRDSYAGRKGQDRNVGVIGIALFPERERPVRYLPRPYERDERARGSYDAAPPAKAAPVPNGGAGAMSRAPNSPVPSAEAKRDSSSYAPRASERAPEPERSGLGTEFGERRDSSVNYTSFQRENATRPSYIVEMRYNDRQGLLALGIPIDETRPSSEDLSVRESADPFPRSRFASPPR